MTTIIANYGYDIHSIELSANTLVKIKNGLRVDIDGQGFMHEEDGMMIDHWVFNDEAGQTYFYLDNGAEYFCNDWNVSNSA